MLYRKRRLRVPLFLSAPATGKGNVKTLQKKYISDRSTGEFYYFWPKFLKR